LSPEQSDYLRPSVFVSYSYSDPSLRPILDASAREAGWEPKFADEIGPGLSIFEAVRNLIISSDAIAIVLSREASPNLFAELQWAISLRKSMIVLVDAKIASRKSYESASFLSQVARFPFARGDVLASAPKEVFEGKEQLRRALRRALRSKKPRLARIKSRLSGEALIDALKKSMKKNVLVLGKDGDREGRARIDRIERVVIRRGYLPRSLKKLPDIPYITLENKMLRVASLCRFVLVEDSRPSGAIDEKHLCITGQFVTATLKEAGRGSTWMQAYYPVTFPLMAQFCYKDRATRIADRLCDRVYSPLEKATEVAIEWANTKIAGLEALYRRYYS